MFKVIKYEGKARRGKFKCAHGGEVQTPVFMNVGTQAAIKGGVSALDLKDLGCQIELSNTYHLHLRPGDDVVCQMGGLHKFMHWDGPILTDSISRFDKKKRKKGGRDKGRDNRDRDKDRNASQGTGQRRSKPQGRGNGTDKPAAENADERKPHRGGKPRLCNHST